MTMMMTGAGKAKGVTPLSAPTNLAAEVGQSGGNPAAFLTWDTAFGVTWKIEKSTNSGSSYSQIGTSATNSYTDTTFAADSTAIRYRVKATDGSTTSGPSNVAGACLLTTPGTGTFAFPVGFANAQVVCVGQGAAGAGGNGGGGGGLAIKASTLSGDYNYQIGTPGDGYESFFIQGAETCSAVSAINQAGGAAGDCVGDTKTSGGNGETAFNGGAGGGAGGKTGNGQAGAIGVGGAAGTGGTLSGKGGDTGQPGATFGGGGADGQLGAGGCIALTWQQAS